MGGVPAQPQALLETGKGAPWPNEIKLDAWE
jgi:hypothetical protein